MPEKSRNTYTNAGKQSGLQLLNSVRLKVFQRDKRKQHRHVYSCFPFLLAETPWTYSLTTPINIVAFALFTLSVAVYPSSANKLDTLYLKWLTTTSWFLDCRSQVPVSSTRTNKVPTRGCDRNEIPRNITASWITPWITITVRLGERGINFALNHPLLCPGKRREQVRDNV